MTQSSHSAFQGAGKTMWRNESAMARSRFALGLALALIALLALDPYSYGAIGGDVWYERISWQVAIAGAQLVLLATAVAGIHAGQQRWALAAALTEAVLFMAANAVYIVRDGTVRFVIGYAGVAWLALLLLLGLAVRILLLRALAGKPLNAAPNASV